MNQDFVRLDRFNGANFTRWKDKLKFMLIAAKVFYILDPDLPPIAPPNDDDSDEQIAKGRKEKKMKLCVEDSFLILCQIVFTICIHLRSLHSTSGMH